MIRSAREMTAREKSSTLEEVSTTDPCYLSDKQDIHLIWSNQKDVADQWTSKQLGELRKNRRKVASHLVDGYITHPPFRGLHIYE